MLLVIRKFLDLVLEMLFGRSCQRQPAAAFCGPADVREQISKRRLFKQGIITTQVAAFCLAGQLKKYRPRRAGNSCAARSSASPSASSASSERPPSG
jgi:hypothetical protein